MIMIKLFNKFIAFILNITKSLKSQWEKIEPSVKEAFLKASKVVDILDQIRNNPTLRASVLISQNKIDDSVLAILDKVLPAIAKNLGIQRAIIEKGTIDEKFEALAKYLKDEHGIAWASKADQLYKMLAVALSDEKVTFDEAQQIGKWVYDEIIKPKK